MALLVNAFDFRETDNNANELESSRGSIRSSVRKLFHTRKSRLFVAKYREPFRLYELQVLESSRFRDSSLSGGSLTICEPAENSDRKQLDEITDEGKKLSMKVSASKCMFFHSGSFPLPSNLFSDSLLISYFSEILNFASKSVFWIPKS